MIRKIFPHPFLSVTLGILWMLLVNRLALGSLVMATILAIIIPHASAAYWPARPRLIRPLALLGYIGIVLYDVILSSFAVAKIILVMPSAQIKSAFITVPIDLSSSEAITVLAGTITMTPGTLTVDIAADRRSLLVHSLHAPDPEAIRDQIKSRYEARLKRIFA